MTNTVVRQVVESTQQSISLCLVKDLYLVQKDAEIKRVKTVDEDLDVNEKVRFVCYSKSWFRERFVLSVTASPDLGKGLFCLLQRVLIVFEPPCKQMAMYYCWQFVNKS